MYRISLKRLAFVFTAIIFIQLMIPAISVFSASDVIINVSSASGDPNSNVDIDVTVSENSEIAAMNLRITYDTSKIECIDAQPAEATSTGICDITNSKDTGTILIAYANLDPMEKRNLLKLKFLIRDTAIGDPPITLSVDEMWNEDSVAINSTVNNGTITITNPNPNPTNDTINNSSSKIMPYIIYSLLGILFVLFVGIGLLFLHKKGLLLKKK